MESYNKRKNDQLGMPHGTANNILRKSIMFQLVKDLNRDVCYRCNKKIETIEDFSIDHKEAWLDNDPNLFWDLDNIAFSHLKCNIAHRRINYEALSKNHIANRKVGPEGTAWCGKCKDFRPREEFTRNNARWNGLQDICKSCRKEYRNK